MSSYNISGIQQVGIGVADLDEAWTWYARHFGMDLPIFNDEAEASLMTEYTGKKVHRRRAVLAMNLIGGGGFEIWQFTSRKPSPQKHLAEEGDLGISHVLMRTSSIQQSYNYFKKIVPETLSEIEKNELGSSFFSLIDPFGNAFKIIEDDYCFMQTKSLIGGVMGVTIGVESIEESLNLYQKLLNYDQVVSRTKNEKGIERVWLRSTQKKKSAFSELLGPTQLELVCDTRQQRSRLFNNRFWGDLGFIHVCFDVQQMNLLREACEKGQFPFVVDSENSFDMGEAAGQFSYVEDRCGTLIELVETHKVPILKKMGWYINLKNKVEQKPLSRIIFKALALNRVKK